MPSQNGAGNWIIKTLNGVGLVGIFATVAMGAIQWKNISDLGIDFDAHCAKQEQRDARQEGIDDGQDKTVETYNMALTKIDTNVENMKEDILEIKAILRTKP